MTIQTYYQTCERQLCEFMLLPQVEIQCFEDKPLLEYLQYRAILDQKLMPSEADVVLKVTGSGVGCHHKKSAGAREGPS